MRSNQASWGDTQFAEGLGRAITRLAAAPVQLLFRGESPLAGPGFPPGHAPVLIRIVGPHLEEPQPGMPNILWMISPPNLATMGMLGRYQARFCASEVLSQRYSALNCPMTFLPQASEASHFHPGRREPGAPDIDLLFVGGLAERAGRRIVLDAVAAGFQPQIWGPGWKGAIPDHLWKGERLDYDGLTEAYARAKVILNSHMPHMARLGFMSNRSYDALMAGAMVVSDPVAGFSAPDLPELTMVATRAELQAQLSARLQAPALSMAERLALHDRMVARHSFDQTARVLLDCAGALLAEAAGKTAVKIMQDKAAAPPLPADPARSATTLAAALDGSAQEILALAAYLADPVAPALPPDQPVTAPADQGVIHALMADQREMQAQARKSPDGRDLPRITALAARARRLHEALLDRTSPLAFRTGHAPPDYLLNRVINDQPLWAHTAEGFDRDGGKSSLRLWPRREPAQPARAIGVFIHLYYDALTPVFAARLAHINAPLRLYISTDTPEKAARIGQHLDAAGIGDADIRVMKNRGRDIHPKLYGFADAYENHDIVLHLHGKKSLHSGALDEWLSHILDCLLGPEQEVNRILSFFDSIPQLGMITPLTFRKVLGAAHWGDNLDIARELAWRLGMETPLPGANQLRFPVGSMFWARTAALRPLLDLDLGPQHFPPETGQVDGTLAHALERMLGLVVTTGGYHLMPVSGAQTRLHAKFQLRFGSNGELRRALEARQLPFQSDLATP
ncbi:glycosyl transferase [Xinfangfangia sp. D13-10-4-6]|uniref:rhamnan synthesis F family protein n=1 Tax=Pseudogemmobacter hezensis TaxID=2737662 RepID=UPI00155733F0|nr:rhamnan synthesis F family protein [Pseudogemmobacter hezensis]NPD14711.1 glycosyl transferase [Pseudogemmobacter hezensis]